MSWRERVHRVENGVVIGILGAMALLPVIEILSRGSLVPSSIVLVQELTLWIGLLGAALASREGRQLAITTLADRLRGRLAGMAAFLAAAAGTTVAALLAWASVIFVRSLTASPTRMFGVPEWVWALALPIGFSLVAARQLLHARLGVRGKLAVLVVAALAGALGWLPDDRGALLVWPGLGVLVVAAALGAPLYSLLGGAALVLFRSDAVPIASIPLEAYRLVVSPSLPTIPLFTMAGYVLAEGGASRRLVRAFQAWFGWLPGGLAVAAASVCAFFTCFTGGSGVTILALGGLLLPALLGAGYRERYSLGLLTASGSLGLLFPPSLPVILYGIVAETSIRSLFAGALVPGLLLLLVVAATGVGESFRSGAGRRPFRLAEALGAAWEAKWDLVLPGLVLLGIFGGFTTFVEAAALTACYAVMAECLLNRELGFRKDLPRVLVKSATTVGGVLVILCVALGLTSYLVDAQVPTRAAEWVKGSITTRLGFLLALNLFLLVVGCLMDIFSAIVVVVPIIKPMAEIYGVDPIHLGVIFVANLELGYLTPPVGLNLFLAAFRFERPFLSVTRAVLPFLLGLLVVVLLITYVPALTRWGVELFGGLT